MCSSDLREDILLGMVKSGKTAELEAFYIGLKIGRASCRVRGFKRVLIWVVAG